MSNVVPRLVVFVHGWSVTHTNTYGGLPDRLVAEAQAVGLDLLVKHIYLSRYISFHDEVRLRDISRAFQDAVERELADLVKQEGRFACITHSTGGPVIRDWWWRHYKSVPSAGVCPMSHLVMLAPANFGSALAQLGKARLGRIKAWFGGVEPGEGVLNWLELGSSEAWQLNSAWIDDDGSDIDVKGIFPFVLTGQSIDRKLYDNLNTYTGEMGSDGVVRVAAANMNSTRVTLSQEPAGKGASGKLKANKLVAGAVTRSPRTALRVLAGKSHSGTTMGIMRSVKPALGVSKDAETLASVLDCLRVASRKEYLTLCDRFDKETDKVQDDERAEVETRILLPDNVFIHDRYSMVIFRLCDEEGYAIRDFDLLLTAGPNSDPNHLPKGFALDRQANRRTPGTLTFYFNWDVMSGCPEVKHDGRVLRPAIAGAQGLGLRIAPRPDEGFAHYLRCEISASTRLLKSVLLPNQTTLVDIKLRRIVRRGVFELDRGTEQRSFKTAKPGDVI
jgi:hypothetical protein